MINLAEAIRKAGKVQRTIEFQCPYIPEFYVQISYASKFILNQIRDVAREVYTDARTRVREEKLNDEKLRKEYGRQIIQGWRGLTVAKLRKLIPGMVVEGATEESEVPFSQDITVALLEVSLEFESWILDMATNLNNFSEVAEQKKKEQENL